MTGTQEFVPADDLEKFNGRSKPEVPAVIQQDGFLAIIERMSNRPDFSVDMIKQLQEIQEHSLDRNAKQEFNAAMVRAQSKMPQVPKDKTNKGTKPESKYSSYEIIVKYTSPTYTAEGFALSMYEGAQSKEDQKFPAIPDGNVRTFCDVMHAGGWSKTYYVDIPIDDKGPQGTVNKTQPHAKKSSLSYGKSAIMCLIFNIPTGGGIDDDGNLAGGPEFITEEQAEKLSADIKKYYGDDVLFLQYLQADAVETITTKQYATALQWIKDVKKGKAK